MAFLPAAIFQGPTLRSEPPLAGQSRRKVSPGPDVRPADQTDNRRRLGCFLSGCVPNPVAGRASKDIRKLAKELRRVVYRSVACISHDDVSSRDAIFRLSLVNNQRDGITGCLAQPDGHFVQVIEGETRRVATLLDRIRADPRHEHLTILGEWVVSGRLFSGWAMARPDPTPLSKQAFRVCTVDGSGVQVTTALLDLMGPGDHLYSVT